MQLPLQQFKFTKSLFYSHRETVVEEKPNSKHRSAQTEFENQTAFVTGRHFCANNETAFLCSGFCRCAQKQSSLTFALLL